MLSNKLKAYHEDTLFEYKKWVKDYARYDVETAVDYLKEKEVLPKPASGVEPEELAKELVPREAFHLFYRVAPGSNQRVMLIGENPRFQSYSRKWYEKNEGSELLSTGGDMEKLAEVGRTRLLNYLLRSEGSNANYWTGHLSAIFKHIPWLSGLSGGVNQELQQHPDRFYNNVYYTNAWKFATNEGINHAKGRCKLAHPRLHDEIEIVDPDLLVVCSGAGWRFTIGEGITSDNQTTSTRVESLDGSPIYGHYDGTGPDKSAGGVFDINGRVVATAKHPGRYTANGTRQALKRAREYL